MKYLSRSLHKDKIKVHLGDAMEIIPRLDETFDMVFIDATNACIPSIMIWYSRWSVRAA